MHIHENIPKFEQSAKSCTSGEINTIMKCIAQKGLYHGYFYIIKVNYVIYNFFF